MAPNTKFFTRPFNGSGSISPRGDDARPAKPSSGSVNRSSIRQRSADPRFDALSARASGPSRYQAAKTSAAAGTRTKRILRAPHTYVQPGRGSGVFNGPALVTRCLMTYSRNRAPSFRAGNQVLPTDWVLKRVIGKRFSAADKEQARKALSLLVKPGDVDATIKKMETAGSIDELRGMDFAYALAIVAALYGR
jgi:hypothetical protein